MRAADQARRILIPWMDLQHSIGPAEEVLRAHGIDPTQPYTYVAVPRLHAWRVTQPPAQTPPRRKGVPHA
jgi:hypothetical protein